MGRDAEAKPDMKTARLFDKRTVDRNIKKGLLTRKDYEKHLKALDDVADKGVFGGPEVDEAPEPRAAVDDVGDDTADDADDEADEADEAEASDGSDAAPGTNSEH
jgi:hypothetical protein